MNYSLIALGVVLIIVLFFLYRYLYTKKNDVFSNVVLLTNANAPVSFSMFDNPTSKAYSYSLWIYLNNKVSQEKKIFDDNILKVSVDTTGIFYSKTATSSVSDKKYILKFENSLPLQQWFYITIVVNAANGNNVIDTYYNGKLTSSVHLDLSSTPTFQSNITLGTADAYIAGFQRTSTILQPKEVWDNYMQGNSSSFSQFPYGLNLISTKNQIDQKQYALL